MPVRHHPPLADTQNPWAVQEAVSSLYVSDDSWSKLGPISGVKWEATKPRIDNKKVDLIGSLSESDASLVASGSQIRVNQVHYTQPAVNNYVELLHSLFSKSLSLNTVALECTGDNAAALKPAFYVMQLDDETIYVQAMTIASKRGVQTQLSFTRYRPNNQINKFQCK